MRDRGQAELIRRVRFTTHRDPLVAKASRKQHDKRKDRLEFQIQMYVYAME